MSASNEIVQIEQINKALTTLNGTLDQTSAKYLTIVKNINDSQATVKLTVQTQENLTKAQKETADTTQKLDTLGKQLQASEQKLKQTEDERLKTIIQNRIATTEATKAITDKVKAEGLAETSLVRMRQKLKELTEQYDKAEVRTKASANEINKLSREIGKAEEATNRHQRNVGNYGEAFGKFKGIISSLPGPLGSAMGAAEGLVTKLGAFGPVGLWVGGAIMSIGAPLAAFFLKSEKGVEMLERKFAGFKASISVLVGELIKSGDAMTEAFDKPAKSTFWTSVLSVFGPSLGALGVRMDFAKTSAEGYTKQLQEMEDAERGLIVPRAQANLKIKEAMLLYNDEGKSLSVRINALKDAIKLENETADIEIISQGKRVANLRAINEQKKQAGQLRDSDDLALQNAIAREIELQTESAGRQIRTTARIRTATEELTKKAAADAKILADKKIYEDTRMSYAILDNGKMVLKETKVTDSDGLKSNQEYLDAKLKQAEEEAAKEKQLQEDLQQAKIDLAVEAGNAIFEFRDMALQKELNSLQVEKDAKLSNTKLTTEQRAAIEADYEKKANAIKAKQAKNEKLQALFNIAINTAVASMKTLASTPLPAGLPLLIFTIAMGAVQAALVAAQPIPKYKDGTKSAESRGIFGEAGLEVMFPKSGGAIFADKPTYFDGDKFKGAQIYSNPETKKMMSLVGDRNIIVKNQNDPQLLDQMKRIEKAIVSKPVAIYDQEHRAIGLGNSNHQTIYLNRLTRSN